MNNPKKLNGWTEPMMLKMQEEFKNCAADAATKVLIVTAAQEKPGYYCAGVDLSGTIKPMPFKDLHLMIKTSNQAVFEQFLVFPKPIIVAVNGPAIGASVTTATLSDAVIAAETATFNTPFTRLGVTPEGCSSIHFEYLMGKETAARMLGAENFIPTGKEAAEIGLVDKCVPLEELLPTAEALAESWIKQGDARLSKRSHRGRDDTAHLVAVNEQESKDLADAFLSVKFLSVQADFLASKGKTVPSMVFKALIALRPIWKNFYTPYAKE
jgi:enoyl-CoA hydratase/carnithine racemase